jgi:hypothetical protein
MMQYGREGSLLGLIGCLRRQPWSCNSEALRRRVSGSSLKEHESEELFGCGVEICVSRLWVEVAKYELEEVRKEELIYHLLGRKSVKYQGWSKHRITSCFSHGLPQLVPAIEFRKSMGQHVAFRTKICI